MLSCLEQTSETYVGSQQGVGEALFSGIAAQFDGLIAGVNWQRLSARIQDVPRLL